MTRYEQGFMNKCAEYGVDAGTSLELMKVADHGLTTDDVWSASPRVRVHGGRTGARVGAAGGGILGLLAGIARGNARGGNWKSRIANALVGTLAGSAIGSAATSGIMHHNKASRRMEISDILGLASTRDMDTDDTMRIFDKYKQDRTRKELERTLKNDPRTIVDTRADAPKRRMLFNRSK